MIPTVGVFRTPIPDYRFLFRLVTYLPATQKKVVGRYIEHRRMLGA